MIPDHHYHKSICNCPCGCREHIDVGPCACTQPRLWVNDTPCFYCDEGRCDNGDEEDPTEATRLQAIKN